MGAGFGISGKKKRVYWIAFCYKEKEGWKKEDLITQVLLLLESMCVFFVFVCFASEVGSDFGES